ncbi:uncharacterized [Tachysurus ichikawai]
MMASDSPARSLDEIDLSALRCLDIVEPLVRSVQVLLSVNMIPPAAPRLASVMSGLELSRELIPPECCVHIVTTPIGKLSSSSCLLTSLLPF